MIRCENKETKKQNAYEISGLRIPQGLGGSLEDLPSPLFGKPICFLCIW